MRRFITASAAVLIAGATFVASTAPAVAEVIWGW